ncbi:MAG TPA: hypothetical protein VEU55_05920 [Gemmatimonadales bacterium]|nr:hypothetical protein [Gemmatimonadales bacterium]
MGEFGWAIGVGIIILAVSLGRTLRVFGRVLAERSTGAKTAGDPGATELRTDVEELRQRLTDLEERGDFTERLLAKRREGERLAPPS